MKKILLSLILILTFLLPIVSAERPEHHFNKTVFANLPDYPSDLNDIKELFSQNKINITKIPSQYYLQPEFYPSWSGTCEYLYKVNRTHHGIYGFNIYPSSYYLYLNQNEEETVTAFLSNGFGIEVKTGISINISYDSSIVSVERLQPSTSYILLEETYPQFTTTWVQPLILEIKLLKSQNATIEVYNSKPPSYQDEIWRNLYGVKYATPEKFTTDVPKLTINIISTSKETVNNQESQIKSSFFYDNWLFITLIFAVIIISISSYGVYRKCRKVEKS